MNGWAPSTITREVMVQLVAPGDGRVSLPVVLHYDTADPYAVHATFRTGQGEGVSWVFARELLTLGVHQQCGEGDEIRFVEWFLRSASEPAGCLRSDDDRTWRSVDSVPASWLPAQMSPGAYPARFHE